MTFPVVVKWSFQWGKITNPKHVYVNTRIRMTTNAVLEQKIDYPFNEKMCNGFLSKSKLICILLICLKIKVYAFTLKSVILVHRLVLYKELSVKS